MTPTLRKLRMTTSVAAEVVIDGRPFINFGGSSYLGLASNATIVAAGAAALSRFGSGIALHFSQQIATEPLEAVESIAARFFETDAALYLSSGYHFGLAATAMLREQFDVVFFDEAAHHALHDGIAASGLRSHAFRHLDVEDLEAQIGMHLRVGERPLVATDGLYSTLGEIAPLDDLARAIEPYGGRLLVD